LRFFQITPVVGAGDETGFRADCPVNLSFNPSAEESADCFAPSPWLIRLCRQGQLNLARDVPRLSKSPGPAPPKKSRALNARNAAGSIAKRSGGKIFVGKNPYARARPARTSHAAI
jgi:hypothetical protein